MKNGVMMQYFEWELPNDGMLWTQLEEDAHHLQAIGITAVWIPPAYKADEQQDEGYASYDLYDLGEFDQKNTVRTKYGTRNELESMIQELHACDISVYLDVVMNHKSWGDHTEKVVVREVDPNQRNKAISQEMEIQAWTAFDFPKRNNQYSDFKWRSHHFSGTDYDDATKRSGVFRIVGENKYWDEGVDTEKGNYDFLLGNDLDLNHPEVVGELQKWGVWVATELNLDGMRLDAVKHMKDLFVKDFIAAVRAEKGKSFYAVGEYWKGDVESLEKYLEKVEYSIDLFDVPLHYNLFEASEKGEEYDLQDLLKGSLVMSRPQHAVTFVDNHDSQYGSSLESQVQDWFKPMAYGLILLMESGYPCVFYGDYYGMGCLPSPHITILNILLYARKTFAYGKQQDYFTHPNIAGLVRLGDEEHPGSGLVFLISNHMDGSKVMGVGENRKGEVWYDLTCSVGEEVTIDEKGNGNFQVKGRNLSVWVKK